MKLLVILGLFVQAATPDRVEIVPASIRLEPGESHAFKAVAYTADGDQLEGASARWHVPDRGVIGVDQDGVVTAFEAGTIRLVAVINGKPGYAEVTVVPPPAAGLRASLPVPAVLDGTTVPITLFVYDRNGRRTIPSRVKYRSSDRGIVDVDQRGRVTGLAPGMAQVYVSAEGHAATVDVHVVDNPAVSYQIAQNRYIIRQGDVVRFRVQATDRAGDPVEGVYAMWTVTGEGATIENEGADGVFVAEQPSGFTVTAEIGTEIRREVDVVVGRREYADVLELTGRGPIAHHHSGDMWVFEGVDGRDYAYVGTFMHDWMKVFDVTDPTRPILTDSVQVDARRINDVKIHPNNRLGVITREGASDRRNGVVLLDLATPAHPTILSEFTRNVTGGVHNVWIEGDLVYACHNGTNALHILDISDPHHPREVGRWELDKRDKTLHDVIVQDGYAYVSYWDDGLVTLDVGAGSHGGTPTEPAFVSRVAYPGGHTHVAWRNGRYLFVGDEIWPQDYNVDMPLNATGYVHVFDMTDIEAPVEVARYEVPDAGAHNLWADNDKLYVGYYQGGLRVLDISGELRGDLYRQGREIAMLRTTDAQTMVPGWPMAWGAQLHKGYIFSSDLNSGLWITRLSRPSP